MIFSWRTSFATLGIAFLLVACGGGSSGTSQGTQVDLFAAWKPGQASSALGAGPKQFANSEGRQIRIQTGYLVVWSIELKKDCTAPGFVFMNPFNGIISSAHAHADASPQKFAVPSVLALTDADETNLYLGELSPAAGDYCGVHTEILKADSDAQFLPGAVDMVNRVVYLEGEYLADDLITWVPFTLDSGVSLLPAQRRFPVELALNAQQLSGDVLLDIDYQTWFDGVDFSQISDTTQVNLVLNNITGSITASWM